MTRDEPRLLGPVDNAFYYVDRPETPMNLGAITIYDGPINFEDLITLIDSRIHQAPIYRQKVIQAPFSLGSPMWVSDPNFYVRNHVFRRQLPQPGTEEQLREIAGEIVGGMLERHKPLWEIYLIEGLENNRSAMLFKVHHCMVDGLSAIELFTLLLDLSPEYELSDEKPLYDPPELPETPKLLWDSTRLGVPNTWNLLNKVGDDIAFLGSLLSKKESRRKTFTGVANLLSDNVTPLKKLSINGKNSGRMNVAWAEFSLHEIKAIKKTRDATVNDVMLSILSEGLRRYFAEKNAWTRGQDFLRVLVPVSMRKEEEKGQFGNRISVMPVDITLHEVDLLERISQIKEYTQTIKESHLSEGVDMILTLPSLMAPFTQPLVWSLAPMAFSAIAHTWSTNVAGPQIPVYMLGHRLEHVYGFFPINPTFGLNCVIASYNQKITMNLTADQGIVPDVEDIRDFLYHAYSDIRDAAKIDIIEEIPIYPSRKYEEISETAESNNTGADNVESITEDATIKEEVVEKAGAGAAKSTSKAKPKVNASSATSNGTAETTPVSGDTASSNTVNGTAKASNKPAGPIRMFTEPWAEAYYDSLNSSQDYYNASTKWRAGALALVMKASPKDGYPKDTAVFLDLHEGKCRKAVIMAPGEADKGASFIIEGDYSSWQRVLSGNAQPLGMIMRGKLKLRKGSIGKLMPFTQSAQELIKCAQSIN